MEKKLYLSAAATWLRVVDERGRTVKKFKSGDSFQKWSKANKHEWQDRDIYEALMFFGMSITTGRQNQAMQRWLHKSMYGRQQFVTEQSKLIDERCKDAGVCKAKDFTTLVPSHFVSFAQPNQNKFAIISDGSQQVLAVDFEWLESVYLLAKYQYEMKL